MDVSASGATGRWEENRKRTGWGPTVGKTMGLSTMGSEWKEKVSGRGREGEDGLHRVAGWQGKGQGAFILQLYF